VLVKQKYESDSKPFLRRRKNWTP